MFSTPRPFSDIFLFFQANSVKMSRYFITCFNVSPDFATNFKFQKSKGQGEFGIKYMEAVFNKEAESGEFFMRLVWDLSGFQLDRQATQAGIEALARQFDLRWELTLR